MSTSGSVLLPHDVREGLALELRRWYEDLPISYRGTMDRLLGHSMSFLHFQVPSGFVPGILTYWMPDRHVFRLGTHEITPTLEEYARITGLPLDGSCIPISIGSMRR